MSSFKRKLERQTWRQRGFTDNTLTIKHAKEQARYVTASIIAAIQNGVKHIHNNGEEIKRPELILKYVMEKQLKEIKHDETAPVVTHADIEYLKLGGKLNWLRKQQKAEGRSHDDRNKQMQDGQDETVSVGENGVSDHVHPVDVLVPTGL